MDKLKKAIYIMDGQYFDGIYSSDIRNQIDSMVDIDDEVYETEAIQSNLSLLDDIEIIFSGWGMVKLDNELLQIAEKLKAVFYSAGSVNDFITDAVWDRKIKICSAYAANAIPVADFTLAQISRRVIKLLKNVERNILLYCAYLNDEQVREIGVEPCGIDDIFTRADVVSLHAAANEQNRDMITGDHFRSMKHGASFINTTRGMLLCESEMIETLKNREDLTAVLDVTYPEPPEQDSELYQMENVVLTPHIAGSFGPERSRLAEYMVEECRRYLDNEPLQWQITQEQLKYLA